MITFKKYAQSKKAQVVLEYFILLAVFTAICLFVVSSDFFKKVQTQTEVIFDSGKDKIVNTGSDSGELWELSYWY
ncbi:MAG: hypothetical protein AB1472_00540 [Candidatus Omnitrophota bacterium]